MTTPYAKAWKQWITSRPAIRILESMGSASIYSENKLREAFDAGWRTATVQANHELSAAVSRIERPAKRRAKRVES